MVGYLLLYARTSMGEEFRDFTPACLVSGGLFTLAAILGLVLNIYTVLDGRQRRIKRGVVIAFVLTELTTILSLATIFATNLIYSLRFVDLPAPRRGLSGDSVRPGHERHLHRMRLGGSPCG